MSSSELDREQAYVSSLYARLDQMREQAGAQLGRVLAQSGGTHQDRSQRDAFAAAGYGQIAEYDAMENGLVFGRLQFGEDEVHYIGRRGLFEDSAERRQLLMDWRAPAARPFYLATAAAPEGVRVRRHIRTTGRTVTGFDDEILDLAAVDTTGHDTVTGESVLLASLNASRTGRMGDIVETIQAEQDRIIRHDVRGVLVVQGGPGTGKTAVALHRAAYLLYTHRRELTTRGVLVVGPNPTFLGYIGRVLPSLGETSALLATVGDLFPGVTATRDETPEAAAVKGSLAMAEVIADAVRDRQWVPEESLEVTIERDTYHLDAAFCERVREQARRSLRPHNRARPIVADMVVDELARQIAERIGGNFFADEPNLLEEGDRAVIRGELREDPGVTAALDELWPVLTPQGLLEDLYQWEDLLESAAPGLTGEQRAALKRAPGGGWSAADVPLLDEAAELIGEDEAVLAERARKRREQQARVAYAQGVLDIAAGSESYEFEDIESEVLQAFNLIDADELAGRFEEEESLTVAERAARDRTWLFGHIIVDEAQELSAMTWRLLMRRCPGRSMTVVGDVAQTGDAAGTTSWAEVFEPYVQDRWHLEHLTVNYRTPAEIMAVAGDVLSTLDPDLAPPASVRENGVLPWASRVDDLGELPGLVAAERAETGDGRLAVIAPTALLARVAELLPDAAVDGDLESPVVVLDVKRAKGLEFDTVVLVEPEDVVAESPRGLSDLYVALTRATQRLGVVHTGPLPEVLARLK
ncbi:DNA helicase [Actinorhabdospora filicis]|uniref:DNA helicase n=1 Tax=Actinorhabdospora filicis TaxID=1785913 RepID=A0A9W6SR58_9ACTN|nr:UvrD-helicase domain-containing protein [Actinorhabdospora filicis]GLZ80838.1 DNA helicase [Actinorhabdospora filicis]